MAIGEHPDWLTTNSWVTPRPTWVGDAQPLGHFHVQNSWGTSWAAGDEESVKALLKRLMEYLDLPDVLKELLVSAAKHPTDKTFWGVIADCLEERGLVEDSHAMRSKL